MSFDWGPHYIVPMDVLRNYSGAVVPREGFDNEMLCKELEALGITGPVVKITNPWYYRKKSTDTWVKSVNLTMSIKTSSPDGIQPA